VRNPGLRGFACGSDRFYVATRFASARRWEDQTVAACRELFAPPALGECPYRGLARRLVTVGRRAILALAVS
jgi:hypothetical protein